MRRRELGQHFLPKIHRRHPVIRLAVAAALIGVPLIAHAPSASAAVSVSVALTVPTTVAVGQTAPASLAFTNTSTFPDRTFASRVSAIRLMLSCGSNASASCATANADPGVFTPSATGAGRPGTACAGYVFAIGAPDAGNRVTFTPDDTLDLAYNSTCVIDFDLAVASYPVRDAAGTTGRQTAQAAAVTLTRLLGSATGTSSALVTVNKGTPGFSTTASPGGHVGTAITDTLTLTGFENSAVPTGTAEFILYGPDDDDCSQIPVFASADRPLSGTAPRTAVSEPFTPEVPGTYRWVASYSGDANYAFTQGACNDINESVTITPLDSVTLTTTASAATSLTDLTLTDTATVLGVTGEPAPTGTVAFRLYGPDDDNCEGTPIFTSLNRPLAEDGTAQSTGYAPTSPGVYRWVATYSGDGNYAGFTAACNEPNESTTVAAPTVTLTHDTPPAVDFDETFTDTLTVTGNGPTPAGTVTFNLYGPDDLSCTGEPYDTVGPITLSGEPATASSGPTLVDALGAFAWRATYTPTGVYAATTTPCGAPNSVTIVNQATTAIATTASPGGPIGTKLFDTATLPGHEATATGQISFALYGPNDATCSNAPAFTDVQTITVGEPTVSAQFTTTANGVYRWIAAYSGDDKHFGDLGECNEPGESVTIAPTAKATPTVTTQASPSVPVGGSIFDTATISGGNNPTGSITFRLYGPGDTNCTGTPLLTAAKPVNGNGSYQSVSRTVNTAGVYRWRASYSGDANNTAVNRPCNDPNESVTVTSSTTGLKLTAKAKDTTIANNTNTSVTATMTSAKRPTGNLVFKLYGPTQSTCAGTPKATFTVLIPASGPIQSPNFKVNATGKWRWRVSYAGDANNPAKSTACGAAPLTVTVS